ncbi:MAG TPA: DegV family protein [Aggregatilineales bacterium]|nr:DegV family protein [Aggregatilineales bacterium]
MAPRVKLVVDSTTDLPADWLARWDIPVLTPFVNFGEESFPDDGVSLTRAEFYRRLASGKGLPSTSAPAPGLAQELYRRQLKSAEHVVAFSVASQFSSIYNTMRLAAEEVDPKRVTVVDSGQVSMALGWMVSAAAEAAERGAGLEEVIAAALRTRDRVRLYAVIDTLEYLRRGGRVSTLVASLGTLLQIKPIIEVNDGIVTTLQRARTMSRGLQSLIDLAHAQAPLERLAVLHTNYPDGAAALRERLSDIAPENTILVDITTAIGTHVGPNALGVATVRKVS